MSQEDLAGAAPIDRTYLSQIERQVGNATVEVLERLAAGLDVPISELFQQPKVLANRSRKKSR